MNIQGMVGTVSDSRRSIIIVGVILGFLSLIIAGLVIALVFARRKAERLEAHIRQLDEQNKQDKESLRLKNEAAIQDQLKAAIAGREEQIKAAKEQVVVLDQKREKFNENLKGVTSWDDLEVSPPPSS
jgi:uncharacterized protein HemX